MDDIYMNFARGLASKSKAKRKKVGSCLVTKHGVCLTGYNGTPRGWDNTCEDENNNTKSEVLHAELNCLLKAAKEGVVLHDSVCYVTLAPCTPCSAMLYQAGVSKVVYLEDYRDMSGIEYLKKYGVEVEKFVDK